MEFSSGVLLESTRKVLPEECRPATSRDVPNAAIISDVQQIK